MRRRFLMVLLAVGMVGGYATGFASCARHAGHCGRGNFEQHVADVCAGAALRAEGARGPGATPGPRGPGGDEGPRPGRAWHW